jgi:hypothetical protein
MLPGFGTMDVTMSEAWGRIFRVRDQSFGSGYAAADAEASAEQGCGAGGVGMDELLKHMPATPVVGKEPQMVILAQAMTHQVCTHLTPPNGPHGHPLPSQKLALSSTGIQILLDATHRPGCKSCQGKVESRLPKMGRIICGTRSCASTRHHHLTCAAQVCLCIHLCKMFPWFFACRV